MRKYLGVSSIFVLILTILILFFLGKIKYQGMLDEYIAIIGFGLSFLFMLLSRKGRLKTILLSVCGTLIIGFILLSLLLGTTGL